MTHETTPAEPVPAPTCVGQWSMQDKIESSGPVCHAPATHLLTIAGAEAYLCAYHASHLRAKVSNVDLPLFEVTLTPLKREAHEVAHDEPQEEKEPPAAAPRAPRAKRKRS